MIGTFFRQHNGCGIGIAANHVRHHRGVNDRQPLDAHDSQVFVNDFADTAGAGGVVDRAGFSTDIGHEGIVIGEVCLNIRRETTVQVRLKRGLLEYVEQNSHALKQGIAVKRGTKVVGGNHWRVSNVRAFGMNGTP